MVATFKCLTSSFKVFQRGKHTISKNLSILFVYKPSKRKIDFGLSIGENLVHQFCRIIL